jgi:hydroxyacylglutathione hydrolase
MSALEIMKDLFFIERGYLNSNHFVYRSKQPVLVDTGYISDFATTERLIKNLGVNLENTRVIINTHTHCDHIGGNRIIQDRSGCDIALHKVGKYFMDTRDDWSTWWRYFGQRAEFFTCTLPLDDGEVIHIGTHEFNVLHTPGHASDGMALYDKKEKILISGDAIWEDDIPTITMRVEGSTCLLDLVSSLEKLEPFSNFKKALSKSKKKAREFLNHKEKTGESLLKKIIIYTILMHREVDEKVFFGHLMGTYWFKETIDLFFNSEYQTIYEQVVRDFLHRDILRRKDGKLITTVKP